MSSTARQALEALEGPRTPFSEAGFNALQRKIDEYIEDLVFEAVRVMKRKQADTVSPNFVQQASDSLVASRKRRWSGLLGALGGVLLGAAVSSYLDMTKATTLSLPSVLTASALAVIGTVLIVAQFVKD